MIDEQQIRKDAKAAVTRFALLSGMGAEFGFNRASVAWVEAFIENQRLREDLTQADIDALTQFIGAFLGECVIHSYGGNWQNHEGASGIFFSASSAAFPFSKVRKQFENSVRGGDSILGFFDAIPEVLLKKS